MFSNYTMLPFAMNKDKNTDLYKTHFLHILNKLELLPMYYYITEL